MNSSERAVKIQPVLTPWDRKLMAWHEAGHAIVAHYSQEQEQICLISIEPTNEAFGMMKTAIRKQHNVTRTSLVGNISVALAGRLAEELFLREISSCCAHDLNKARDIAIRMVASYGMGVRCGLLSCFNPVDHSFLLLSEHQRENLFLDVNDLIIEARDSAIEILNSHARQVNNVASMILDKGTLSWKELQPLL